MTGLGGPAGTWQAAVMVSIGERVAAYRRRRGLSQVTPAGLVGRSESWLSQVERGRRDIDSLTVIRDLATALDVAPDALIGVNLPAPTLGAGHSATAAIRAYVDGYNQVLTTPPTPDATTAQLLDEAEDLNSCYQAARYAGALTHTTSARPRSTPTCRSMWWPPRSCTGGRRSAT